MRVRVLSDLHTEFHADGGHSFIDSLDPSGCDVLVLAGDISNAAGITKSLEMLCARFKDAPVLHVNGNHEFYGGSWEVTRRACASVRATNYTLLTYDRPFVYMNKMFIGDTLWFAKQPGAPEHCMNDFFTIEGFRGWVYEQNRLTVEALRTQMTSDSIVVMHHLPTALSVHPKYRNSPLNAFFVHDMTELIVKRQPALWVHGHGHHRVNFYMGVSQIACNQHGYPREHTDFDPSFTLEIP